MTKVESLKSKYGFKIGSYKYIIPGGELMKYIGQHVVCVTFTKKTIEREEGESTSVNDSEKYTWTNSFSEATIKSLGEFDPMQMTWLCRYTLKDREDEVLETRILPEGYSFEGKDPEETGKMLRFVPLSKHFEMMEDETFYIRLNELWETRRGLNTEELLTLAKSKGQEATLKYTHNVGALVRLNDEHFDPTAGESQFLWIRIHKLKFYHQGGSKFTVRFSNNDRSWSFVIDMENTEFSFEGDGMFKIIDLSDGNIQIPQIEEETVPGVEGVDIEVGE